MRKNEIKSYDFIGIVEREMNECPDNEIKRIHFFGGGEGITRSNTKKHQRENDNQYLKIQHESKTRPKKDKEIDNGWSVGRFLWFVVLIVYFLGCCCSYFIFFYQTHSKSKTKQHQLYAP